MSKSEEGKATEPEVEVVIMGNSGIGKTDFVRTLLEASGEPVEEVDLSDTTRMRQVLGLPIEESKGLDREVET
jgi:MoxR-like ATPase